MIDEWTIDRVAKHQWPDLEIQRRRYQALWTLEALLFPASVVLWRVATPDCEVLCIAFAVVATIQLPVVICLISQVLGRPIELAIDELSSASRAFRAELRQRSSMTDDEFIRRSQITSPETLDLVGPVRACLRGIDPLCDRVLLNEPLGCLLDGIDYLDVYFALARRFQLPKLDISPDHDGSLRMILDNLASEISRKAERCS
ncbi:hypothetical protein Pan44_03500 [Caulifigura coniformis]|uniref:Uncharacterized protein n=1 Tax=Caulifigura coniformis TaxID=2527983 RepID=A0A517S881_9PLAN|nr:hypothetical protein [Caulifigura coniformis]QDT52341.1 hypothetical protein Pan44_03500 [Caulifigura coniformis]